MTYASKAERLAFPILAAQPAPSYPSQNFEDAGLSPVYHDPADQRCEAKPDGLCRQGHSFTFEEIKDSELNFHRTHESSRAALQEEYEAMTGRASLSKLPHSSTSGALFAAGRIPACLDHGFNHSVYKHLAVQAEHGWQRYMVVFLKTPPKRLAIRYLALGLVFCTLDTLPSMLATIELCQRGFFVPFQFISKRANYGYTVTPNHRDNGKSAAAIAISDRAKLLAAIDAADAAQEAARFPDGSYF